MPDVDGNKTQILREAVIRTIIFFDMFDCPLTAFEIWKYLPVKCSLSEVVAFLEKDRLIFAEQEKATEEMKKANLKMIFRKNGYYFLQSRNNLYDRRMVRYNFADKKFKRAVLTARLFKIIPWIKLIAVGNIIGANNVKKTSDIDLFIVAANKRVWLTRLFCVGWLKILGWRPNINGVENKICLSFFISENVLNLKDLMLLPERKSEKLIPISEILDSARNRFFGSYDDVYFIYWLACLTPVFDKDGCYQRLIRENFWLNECLPNWQIAAPISQRRAGKPLPLFFYKAIDFFLGWLESRVKKIQIKLFPEEIREKINRKTEVVVNEEILKLHTNDRREYYRKKFFINCIDFNDN